MPILSVVDHAIANEPISDVSTYLYPYPCIRSPSTAIEAPHSSGRIYQNQNLDPGQSSGKKTRKKQRTVTMAVSCAQTRSLGSKPGGNGGGNRQQGGLCNERWMVLSKDTFQEIFEKSIDELICLNEPQDHGDDVMAGHVSNEEGSSGDGRSNQSADDSVIRRSESRAGGGQEKKHLPTSKKTREKREQGNGKAEMSSTRSAAPNNSQRTDLAVSKNNSKSGVHRKTHRHSRKQRDSSATVALTTGPTQATLAPGDRAVQGEICTSNESVVGSAGIGSESLLSTSNIGSCSPLPHHLITSRASTPEGNNQAGCVNKVVCESPNTSISTVIVPITSPPPPPPPLEITQHENASLRQDRPIECRAGSSAQWSGSKASELENSADKTQKRPFKGERGNRTGGERVHGLISSCSTSGFNQNHTNWNHTSGSGSRGKIKTPERDVTGSVEIPDTLGFNVDGSTTNVNNRRKADIDKLDRDQLIDSTVSSSVITEGSDQLTGTEVLEVSGGEDVLRIVQGGFMNSNQAKQQTDNKLSAEGKKRKGSVVKNSGGVLDNRQRKNKGKKKNSCGNREVRSGCNNEPATNQSSPNVSSPNHNTSNDNHTSASSTTTLHRRSNKTLTDQDLLSKDKGGGDCLHIANSSISSALSHSKGREVVSSGPVGLAVVHSPQDPKTDSVLQEETQFMKARPSYMTECTGAVDHSELGITRRSGVLNDLNLKTEEGFDRERVSFVESSTGELRDTQVLLSRRADLTSGTPHHSEVCPQTSERLVDVVATQQGLVVGPSFVDVSSSQGPVSKDQSEVLPPPLNTRVFIHKSGGSGGSSKGGDFSREKKSEFNQEGVSLLMSDGSGVIGHDKRVNNNNNNDYNEEELRNTVGENAMSDSNMRVFSGNNKMTAKQLGGSKRRLVKQDNINWISVDKADMMNLVNEIVFEGYSENSSGNEQGYSDDNTEEPRVSYGQDRSSDHGFNMSEEQPKGRGESSIHARSYDDGDLHSGRNPGNPQTSLDSEHADDLAKRSPHHDDGPIDLSQTTDKSQHISAPRLNPSVVSEEDLESSFFDPRLLHHPVHQLLFREAALTTKYQETGKSHTHQSHKSATKMHHSKSNNSQLNSKTNTKQCWVALSKNVVLDIVDTAYDSIDRQLQVESPPKSPLKDHMDNEYVFVRENNEISADKNRDENQSLHVLSQSDKDSDIDVETVDSDMNPDENTYPSYGGNSVSKNVKDVFHYGKDTDKVYHSGQPVSSRVTSAKPEQRKRVKNYNDHQTSSRKRKRNENGRENSSSPSHQLIRHFEDLSSSSPKRSCSPAESIAEVGDQQQRNYMAPLTPSSENSVLSMTGKVKHGFAEDRIVAIGERQSLGSPDRPSRDEGILYSRIPDRGQQSKSPVHSIDQYRLTSQSDSLHKGVSTAILNEVGRQQHIGLAPHLQHSVSPVASSLHVNDATPLRSPLKGTEVDQQRYHPDSGEVGMEKQPSPSSKRGDVDTKRDSPKLGWVAVSKEDVHTIVASVMSEMISTEVCSPRDNSCSSPMSSHRSESSSRSVTDIQQALHHHVSPRQQDREGLTPSPGSLSTNSGPQEDANLPEDETRSLEGSAHTPNSTSSSRGFKWKTSLLKRAREEDEDQLSSDSVSDQSHDDIIAPNELHDQATQNRRSRRSKRKT